MWEGWTREKCTSRTGFCTSSVSSLLMGKYSNFLGIMKADSFLSRNLFLSNLREILSNSLFRWFRDCLNTLLWQNKTEFHWYEDWFLYLQPGVKSTQHLLHEINILLLRLSCLQCLLLGINIKRETTTTTTTRKNNNNRSGEGYMHLFDGVWAHHHGPAQGLVEPVVHAVDQVGQVVHEVPGESRSSLMQGRKWRRKGSLNYLIYQYWRD